MSVGSLVLNRSVWKFVFAMAIPVSIGWFFWYSQQQANFEVEQYKKEQKANPISDELVIQNYAMKEIDDLNRIRWQLVAATGKLKGNGKDVELTDVKVEYFDAQTRALKMRLEAPFGSADQQSKYVKLEGGKNGRVVAEGQNNMKLSSAVVELIKKNEFLASGGVIIDWPGVAKVSGDSASGMTDMSSGPKNFKVVGNTHAEIVMK
jgi:lipopolysaccharide export system protein LptC